MENDTISLLQECDSSSKMAVSSIDEVLDKIKDKEMFNILKESKSHHEKICDEIHQILEENEKEEKEPSKIAQGMSWLKTNILISLDKEDSTIAKLMTEGCNMGVQSLSEYLNNHGCADQKSKDICERLIKIEDKLAKDLRPYLA